MSFENFEQNYHLRIILYLIVFKLSTAYDEICNRTPLDTRTQPLPADNIFVLDLPDLDLDDKYIPTKTYHIKLQSTDPNIKFIAFTIYATGDTVPNEDNPRRPRILDAGRIIPIADNQDTRVKPDCMNTLVEFDTTPKKSVEALWTAPRKENKCVTIYAAVAITPDVWYNAEGPLLKKICEDDRKKEDMPPKENNNCLVCEEARYELKFQGTWSYNTHPRMFPNPPELARFSDVVGASHSNNYYLFKPNSDASEGLKMLAEQGNTTLLEEKILEQLGSDVRTLIKATGSPLPNMTTVVSFRVNRYMHLVSLVSALLPSPDWFVGVANLELCDVETNKWAKKVILNLYPYDAGTDSGTTFGAPNEATSPPKPIALAEIVKGVNKDNVKPFSRLIVDLVRTYPSRIPNCVEPKQETTTDEDGDSSQEPEPEPEPEPKPEPEPESTSRESPTDSGSNPPTVEDVRCPTSQWVEFDCEGDCVEGIVNGYKAKMRYFIVNGRNATTEKRLAMVPEYCKLTYKLHDFEECSEPCEEEPTNTNEPQPESRRSGMDQIRPGFTWNEQ